jgi:Holin of 3TMs, for gene-transfer release
MGILGVGEVAGLADTVINKLWPDKSEAERQQLAAAMQIVQGQIEINKVEAASPNNFTNSARPALIWVCVMGFAVQYVVGPLGEWIALLCGHVVKFPTMDMNALMPMLLGLLGLSGMRSFERVKGVLPK